MRNNQLRLNHVDYLYFTIYNYFYKVSLYRPSLNFRTQAMYLFSIGSGGWLLLFESIYLHFIKHTRFTSPMQSMIFAGSVYVLTAALSHYIFIVKDRDQKIFGKYEGVAAKHPRQRRHLFISLSVLALPYAILVAFAILFPRPH